MLTNRKSYGNVVFMRFMYSAVNKHVSSAEFGSIFNHFVISSIKIQTYNYLRHENLPDFCFYHRSNDRADKIIIIRKIKTKFSIFY